MITTSLAERITTEKIAIKIMNGKLTNHEVVEKIRAWLIELGYIVVVQYEFNSTVVNLFVDGEHQTFRGAISHTSEYEAYCKVGEWALDRENIRLEECKECEYYRNGNMTKTCAHCTFNDMFQLKKKEN